MDDLRTWWLGPLAMAVLAAGCSRLLARSEDSFEPNDTFDRATLLTADQPVQARANQGNLDIFSFQVADAGTRLLFRLESLGLEDCPAFTVTAPDAQVLYRDETFRCSGGRNSKHQPAERVEGATLTLTSSPGPAYELRVPAARAGTHFLTIDEQGEADNMFPLGWDYRLTATIE
jgi:hypothetical protein